MPKKHERAEATARQHEAILNAIHTLERALVSAAPGREKAWMRRAEAALAVVVDEVRQHIESAEGEGGLIPHIETVIGRPHKVTLALKDHKELIEKSTGLLRDLGEGKLGYDEVRERAFDLTAALRRHHAREADLILLAYEQDIGAGD